LILTLIPAFSAASMPLITPPKSPQRVIARNVAGSSVSSETLIRLTPQSASAWAYFGSWLPLVVSVSSSSAPVARWRDKASNSHMMFFRTSGSPPVIRSLRTPRSTNAEHSRSNSSSVSRSFLGRNVMCSDMQ
jgi:hypothetical protein